MQKNTIREDKGKQLSDMLKETMLKSNLKQTKSDYI